VANVNKKKVQGLSLRLQHLEEEISKTDQEDPGAVVCVPIV
jgi:hypothetical protein